MGARGRNNIGRREIGARRASVETDKSLGSFNATDEVLRLTRGTSGVVVHVMEASSLRLQMHARVAVFGPVQRRGEYHEELRQCQYEQHGTQHPALKATHSEHAIHTLRRYPRSCCFARFRSRISMHESVRKSLSSFGVSITFATPARRSSVMIRRKGSSPMAPRPMS